MQLDDFVNRVQEHTGLSTREGAVTVIKAVLETLGERVVRKVWNGIAAQLPTELKDILLTRAENRDRSKLSEFYNRAGARANLKYDDAAERTRQVIHVLREAISGGEWRNLVESLPSGEYAELFGEEPPDPTRPAR